MNNAFLRDLEQIMDALSELFGKAQATHLSARAAPRARTGSLLKSY